MARLPSRKELEPMFPHNACRILEIHARQCLQTIQNYGFQSGGSTNIISEELKRECGKLYRIYKLANELGHDIGQPDYRPQHTVNADERAHHDMWQAMYQSDVIWRSVEAEQAAV